MDSSDCVFTDNVVDGGQQIGISISNTGPKERIYWARNTIRNCVTWNAQIQGEAGGASGHVFRQNTFEGALLNDPKAQYPGQGYGVRFNGNCHNMLFIENSIAGNGHGAIQTCGEHLSGLRFFRNSITENKGPVLTGDPGMNPCWSGNTATGNADNTLPADTQASCKYTVSITYQPKDGDPDCLHFTCKSDEAAHTLKQVLWDFGADIPHTGTETDFRPWSNFPLRVTAIAWDDSGIPAVADTEVRLRDNPKPPI